MTLEWKKKQSNLSCNIFQILFLSKFWTQPIKGYLKILIFTETINILGIKLTTGEFQELVCGERGANIGKKLWVVNKYKYCFLTQH